MIYIGLFIKNDFFKDDILPFIANITSFIQICFL
jgi:hypothetical protein